MYAVLTGDIVNSTQLNAEREKLLLDELRSIFAPYQYEFYRGDSFQVCLPDPRKAISVAMQCRATAITLSQETPSVQHDVRISVGLGTVEEPVKELATAKGEAFLLSGRAFDTLDRNGGAIAIHINYPLVSLTLSVLSDYINSIFRHMTAKQAEVITLLLKGQNQQQVADKLNRSKSTISQHVSAGRWDELEKIQQNFISIIDLVSKC